MQNSFHFIGSSQALKIKNGMGFAEVFIYSKESTPRGHGFDLSPEGICDACPPSRAQARRAGQRTLTLLREQGFFR